MAKAIKNVIPPQVEVTLTLSGEEAETLLTILGVVEGSPVYSRRKHASAIFNTLFDLHLNYDITGASDLSQNGYLYFLDTLK